MMWRRSRKSIRTHIGGVTIDAMAAGSIHNLGPPFARTFNHIWQFQPSMRLFTKFVRRSKERRKKERDTPGHCPAKWANRQWAPLRHFPEAKNAHTRVFCSDWLIRSLMYTHTHTHTEREGVNKRESITRRWEVHFPFSFFAGRTRSGSHECRPASIMLLRTAPRSGGNIKFDFKTRHRFRFRSVSPPPPTPLFVAFSGETQNKIRAEREAWWVRRFSRTTHDRKIWYFIQLPKSKSSIGMSSWDQRLIDRDSLIIWWDWLELFLGHIRDPLIFRQLTRVVTVHRCTKSKSVFRTRNSLVCPIPSVLSGGREHETTLI